MLGFPSSALPTYSTGPAASSDHPLPAAATKSSTADAVLRRHNVRVLGQGKPPLLLCNGFGYNQRLWQYVTTALVVQHQVILFDHVGSGESEVHAYDPRKYASLQGYVQDLIEICQVLNLREAILVGHSVGASIAMLAAIQAPTHFSKVVLLTPSPCYINEPGYYGGFERENLERPMFEPWLKLGSRCDRKEQDGLECGAMSPSYMSIPFLSLAQIRGRT
ncbi:MAG: alpha/beta hydrolase [Hymenobacter sp.]|nr:MAG: alpha/beta hydrolase [Hymenobacter sp.]